MLYHHVVLAKLLQPTGLLVRSHHELPAQQVVPVHACRTHHDQQLLPGGAVSPQIGAQTKTSVDNMLFLDVLNLEELGPYGLGRGVCVQDSNSPSGVGRARTRGDVRAFFRTSKAACCSCSQMKGFFPVKQ